MCYLDLECGASASDQSPLLEYWWYRDTENEPVELSELFNCRAFTSAVKLVKSNSGPVYTLLT